MVEFELCRDASDEPMRFLYRYWPEGDRALEPGLMSLDLEGRVVTLRRAAEGDACSRTTAAELNAMRDSINAMRAEEGEPPLTEEELPTVPDDYVEERYQYFDHARSRLLELVMLGELPQGGTAAWQ